MKRFCYRGQYHDEAVFDFIQTKQEHIKALLADNRLYTFTVFRFENKNLFVYYECVDEEFAPTQLLPGIEAYLNTWPGEEAPRAFVPMTDIYHSYLPNEEESAAWHRTERVVPTAQMSRMNKDRLSSYIFYHVQLQEETPGSNGKHLTIWANENVALLYNEKIEGTPVAYRKGMLDTHQTPADWKGTMVPHFTYYNDGVLYHSAEVGLTLSEADLT